MVVINDFFLQNWNTQCKLETAYITDVAQSAADLTEDRRAILDRPNRTLFVHWTGAKRDETNRLLMELMRGGVQTLTIPFYPEQSVTTIESSFNSIYCDTTNRRWVIGDKVLIFGLDIDGRPINPFVDTITNITPTQIQTLVGFFPTVYPIGSLVFPLMTAEVNLLGDVNLKTEDIGELDLAFIEVLDMSAKHASADVVAPGAFGAQTSSANPAASAATPILNVSPNFADPIKVKIARSGGKHRQGRSSVVDTFGVRPFFGFDFSLLFDSRADINALLSFFDSRRGRLMPFWFVNPQTLWKLAGIGAGFIDVAPSGNIQNPTDFIEYVAVVLSTGTIYVRQVTGIAVVGGNWRISLAGLPGGINAVDVQRVTSAHFVRFAKDAIEQVWTTESVCAVAIELVEILAESVTTTLNFPICTIPCGNKCWYVCVIAYQATPEAISGICPHCDFVHSVFEVGLGPADPCDVTVTIPFVFCPPTVGLSFPLVLHDTHGLYEFMGHLNYGTGIYVWANVVSAPLPCHGSPFPCDIAGFAPDYRFSAPNVPCNGGRITVPGGTL